MTQRQSVGMVWLGALLAFALFIAVWQLAALMPAASQLIPSLGAALAKLDYNGLAPHFAASMEAFALGYLIAAVVGAFLGLACGSTAGGRRVFGPMAQALQAMPLLALAPVIVLQTGIGLQMTATLTFLGGVFAVFAAVIAGLDRAASSQPHPPAQTVVSAPARPASGFGATIMGGLRAGVGSAAIGLVLAEYVASNKGLAFQMMNAVAIFDAATAMAAFILLAVPVLLLFALLRSIEVALRTR